MTEENDSPTVPPPDPDPAAAAPRRWDPPRVRSGQLFESNSLACGKSNPTEGEQCIADPAS